MTSVSVLNELLIEHNCLRFIGFQMNNQDLSYDLTMVLSRSEEIDSDSVTINFHDVSGLAIDRIGGGLTQLMFLQVTKSDRGLDRVNFRLEEREDDKISFNFSSFEEPVKNSSL